MQSFAILRYLGKKYGLIGKTDQEQAREDMLLYQIQDMLLRLNKLMFFNYPATVPLDDPAFQSGLAQLKQDLPGYLDLLEKFADSHKSGWLSGEQISYVDFYAYEIIDWYREVIDKDCLQKYPKLGGFMHQFEQLAPLKEWLASEEYRRAPLVSPFARIGGNRR